VLDVRAGGAGDAAPPRRPRRLDWAPWRTQKIVNWCGHSQEYQPWPEEGGWWRLVPVWDQQDRPDNPLQRHAPATL